MKNPTPEETEAALRGLTRLVWLLVAVLVMVMVVFIIVRWG